jgi:membrane protein required for colicin V production
MQGHWIDFTIIVIIALSVLTGLFRGFVKELVALCVWALAIWLAYHYSPTAATWLEAYIQDNTLRTVVAFLLILFTTLIVGGVLNATLSYILKRTGLSGTDRSLGLIFGFIRGICLVAILMIGVKMTSLPYTTYAKESVLYAKFDPLVDKFEGFMPAFIQQVKAVDVENNLGDKDNATLLVEN